LIALFWFACFAKMVNENSMEVVDLATCPADSVFEADLAIIGGGPAGLTIAREFFGTSTRVIVLESGLLDETPDHSALAEVESLGEPGTDLQKLKRAAFHGSSSSTWSEVLQPYGVRCRALGGSTHAWAGKSAAFDAIDFAERSWVPNSGWPISLETLDPYLDRSARVLNLGPNSYDGGFWNRAGITPPQPKLDAETVRSFFWQFARSRLDLFDIMRFGREFVTFKADNVRVLLNATVTQINLNPSGSKFEGLEISTIDRARSKVTARCAVVAASAIENARLLLTSNSVQSSGIGNDHDLVGRFLMDHVGARVAKFNVDGMTKIAKRFGFYGIRHGGRTHMYMHGLAIASGMQEREQLLNSAVYFSPERSPDDPWSALKRLLRRDSAKPVQDIVSIVSGAGLLAKGIGMKVLTSNAMPPVLKDLIVNTAIQFNPNLVAEEFQSRGLPYKLTAISVDAISEQRPDPNSRIVLSERTDRLGVPLAKVDWRINDDERRTIVRIGQLTGDAFVGVGLPEPILEPWVAGNRPGEGVLIDMAHSAGTTRMSNNPKLGVVDENCQIHGVHGLYVAGGSTFPTNGHANPTLMILAVAIRLADKIKSELARS
jgi:choline dehydrogenase-like flavoprotein